MNWVVTRIGSHDQGDIDQTSHWMITDIGHDGIPTVRPYFTDSHPTDKNYE